MDTIAIEDALTRIEVRSGLDTAIVRAECTTVAPNAEVTWWMTMAFTEAIA